MSANPSESPTPSAEGVTDGLAWGRFDPPGTPRGGVVVIHGADSCKENHYDWGAACQAAGLVAVVYDQRGHGASAGALDGRILNDVVTIAALLPAGLPVALRGSSLGGFVAMAAAERVDAQAVVAICPAPGPLLAAGLAAGAFSFAADAVALSMVLSAVELETCAVMLRERLLLMHAEGDDRVRIASSDALYAASPTSSYIRVPGGSHGSIQHDHALRVAAVQWLDNRLS